MDSAYLVDLILHHHLPNGGWLDFWAKHEELIGQFIRTEKLKPASPSVVPSLAGPLATPVQPNAKTASLRISDPGIRGGIRVAHLHFEVKVFMLKDEQWAKFSGGIIAEAKAKLAKLNAVSFDQAMSLAKGTEALP